MPIWRLFGRTTLGQAGWNCAAAGRTVRTPPTSGGYEAGIIRVIGQSYEDTELQVFGVVGPWLWWIP